MSSHNYLRSKPTAEDKPPRASERKPTPEPERNPVWQSLALRTDSVRSKLAVSRPDDPYEREADRVADKVMRMATTPSGLGYWMAAADGGVFTFGDAEFDGSTGGSIVTQPVVAFMPGR